MRLSVDQVAVVTRETRLEGLLAAYGTKGAAKFRLKQAQIHEGAKSKSRAADVVQEFADFQVYEDEDAQFRAGRQELARQIDDQYRIVYVERERLPNFDFERCFAVVVLGQDGLVANTAKYSGEIPIIGVNPDPSRYDGVLLPFRADQVGPVISRVRKNSYASRSVTLAEATLNDGQRLLAFNDIFVGVKSHGSARYMLSWRGNVEPQSSSGVIVSTGAGSTGWFSSICNMTSGVGKWLGGQPISPPKLEWEARKLVWAVREPFASRVSRCELVAGALQDGEELVLESITPENGVFFSDGIESDFLHFNSGTIARIRCAKVQAKLVVP